MQELPLAIQLKLRESCPERSRGMSGAESAVQEVDVLLEDGRTIEGVRVVDCTYVDDDRFDAELVADILQPAAPPSTGRALLLLGLLLLGIMAMFYFIRQIQPQ